MESEEPSSNFHTGQNLDVLDTVGHWENAEVLFAGNGSVFVHYTGWAAKYDESIDFSSPRILTQWEKTKKIRVNNRIDVYHPIGGWLEARVLELGEESADGFPVKVHFRNYHKKYDRWVDLKDNNEVSIIGSRSKANGIGKKRSRTVSNEKLSEMIKKLLDERAKELGDNLLAKGLFVKKSGGDGNCLFRSISDQLYGTQEHHALIRKTCMDYIEYEKEFFRDYVVEEIEDYIEKKRNDGIWGDDIEIQAISEIYSRPIEIYVLGSEPIRTFHEENEQNIPPLRLAYVGACHYDSIKPKNSPEELMIEAKCGEYEEKFIDQYKMDMQSIIKNRDCFSNCNTVEDTVGEQLFSENREETKVEDELAKALETSETEAILEQIEKAELTEFQKQYEQEKIQEELRKLEEKEIEEAKKLSKNLEEPKPQKPYWFGDLMGLGYSEKEIWFAIEIKGFDPDAVQNFLLDNMCI